MKVNIVFSPLTGRIFAARGKINARGVFVATTKEDVTDAVLYCVKERQKWNRQILKQAKKDIANNV